MKPSRVLLASRSIDVLYRGARDGPTETATDEPATVPGRQEADRIGVHLDGSPSCRLITAPSGTSRSSIPLEHRPDWRFLGLSSRPGSRRRAGSRVGQGIGHGHGDVSGHDSWLELGRDKTGGIIPVSEPTLRTERGPRRPACGARPPTVPPPTSRQTRQPTSALDPQAGDPAASNRPAIAEPCSPRPMTPAILAEERNALWGSEGPLWPMWAGLSRHLRPSGCWLGWASRSRRPPSPLRTGPRNSPGLLGPGRSSSGPFRRELEPSLCYRDVRRPAQTKRSRDRRSQTITA